MDQAANLRRIVSEKRDIRRSRKSNSARIISITSGKGGVGKTSISVNLAASMAKLGKKVLIIDADLGLSNVEIMLGVTPSYNLKHVITSKKEIEQIIINGPFNIDFISGGNGFLELAELSDIEREEILIKIQKLDELYDIIIVDTGAGISKNVTSFLEISDEVLVVATSEPTALTDAYSIVKVISEGGHGQNLGIIINRVNNRSEHEQASGVLINTAKKFLKADIKALGFIYEDVSVRKTIYKKTPFVISYPNSKASACIRSIMQKLDLENKGDSSNGIMEKFKRWFKNK